MKYTTFDTSWVRMTFVGDEDGVSCLFLHTGEEKSEFVALPEYSESVDFFKNEINQIHEYLAGNREEFDIKIRPQGTDFQKRVWMALRKIPYGETWTYKRLAIEVGNEKACRAVGMANSKNPIPIIVPCHRVIGANGDLTGFSSGLKAKKMMLNLEQKHIKEIL